MQSVPCFPFSPFLQSPDTNPPRTGMFFRLFLLYSAPFEHRFLHALRNALSVSRSLPLLQSSDTNPPRTGMFFLVYPYISSAPFEHRFLHALRDALFVSRSLPFCNRPTRTLPAQECFSSFILTFQTLPLNTVFPARSAMCPPFSVLRPPKSPSRREPPLRLIYPPLFKAFPVFSVHVVPRFSHFNSSKSLRPVKFSHASPFLFFAQTVCGFNRNSFQKSHKIA